MNSAICHTFLGHDKNNNSNNMCECVFLIFSLDFSIEFLFDSFLKTILQSWARLTIFFSVAVVFVSLLQNISFTSNRTTMLLSIIPSYGNIRSCLFVFFMFSSPVVSSPICVQCTYYTHNVCCIKSQLLWCVWNRKIQQKYKKLVLWSLICLKTRNQFSFAFVHLSFPEFRHLLRIDRCLFA